LKNFSEIFKSFFYCPTFSPQVTIRQGKEIYETLQMSELPCCIVDLVQKRSNSSNLGNQIETFDLSNLGVTLDLLTITLPREMTLPLKLEPTRRSVSLGSSLSLPEAETSSFLDSIVRDEIESTEERLPPIQVEHWPSKPNVCQK